MMTNRPLEIHACGFNAHEQLQRADVRSYSPSDLKSFQTIVFGDADLDIKFAGWSTTLCTRSLHLGMIPFAPWYMVN